MSEIIPEMVDTKIRLPWALIRYVAVYCYMNNKSFDQVINESVKHALGESKGEAG